MLKVLESNCNDSYIDLLIQAMLHESHIILACILNKKKDMKSFSSILIFFSKLQILGKPPSTSPHFEDSTYDKP